MKKDEKPPEMEAFERGEPLRNLVDREAGY